MQTERSNLLQMPSLRALQAFVEVANMHSIHAAAEKLNITPSAVSHQISTLEEFLGKKLFVRNGKGVILTQIGEIYLHQINGSLSNIGRATSTIINEAHNDVLRVHSSPSFGMMWLMKRLGRFNKKHPNILINLTCSYENLQFSRDNIDIDIRYGHANWDAYHVMTIKNEKLNVYASPEYVITNPINTPDELSLHSLINSSMTIANWDKWLSFFNISTAKQSYNFSFDRSYMSFEAAKQGLGIILESSLMANDLIKENLLTQVFSNEYSYNVNAHHIVIPHSSEHFPKVKAFMDWIRDELQSDGYYL
jgi:DNA-binding transcriptional LysR family regulator